ncbi:MAG: hypothetical protein QOH12_3469, partial [Solirubrobacteraceae bacterium]|nr:hypothetical protein [Solirubrobacteraceae bacterium]
MRRAGFKLGSVVANRRIDAVAGQGGMGVVYRAWNLRLHRVEAVKVIAASLTDDASFRARFEGEMRNAAKLQEHPHVVSVYDAGEGPGGQLYIAMQYVEGTNLEKLIRERRRLDPALAASLISQVASALDLAHNQGIIHRDVKPANVLIAGRDGSHHAYLTDFGLAKRVTSGTIVSGAGLMVGTVDYMPPEQALAQHVDPRADVYALGATLFEALTGQVPYPAMTDIARIVRKLEEPPPMATQTAPGIPPEFDTVIARAMSREAVDRFPSAGELGRAALAAAGRPSQSTVRREIGVGSVLADCLLEAVAGEGGMGVVYRARQLKLGKTVALKLMSRELSDNPVFRARFEREWKIAASIDHPNVIPILWAGDADGVLYIVMRFVGGGSLKEAILERGRLEPSRAVEVIEQLASALDVAHARGLVHRDVKPGNVLIEEETGRVFLTDFGLAKTVGDTDITAGGDLLGSSRYIAPERNRGIRGDEPRGDVYSLGCVLWDLLGGTERLDLARIPGVPPALTSVVGRATALEPSARYASAGELARSARAALEGNVVGQDSRDGGLEPPLAPTLSIDQRRQPFEPGPLSSGVAERVLELCENVLALVVEPEIVLALEEVRRELLAPLRVEILGAPGSGRTTLLNAMLGRRILPSGARFSVPVTFAHGGAERVEIVLEDGSAVDHALAPDGALAELPAIADRLAAVRVLLPLDYLRSLCLIYPPRARRTESQYDSAADARLIAIPAPEVAESTERAEAAVRPAGAAGLSGVNATVVLTKADLAADDAQPIGRRVKEALATRVVAVTPFMGRLAENVSAGLIGEGELASLAELADRRPPPARGAPTARPEAEPAVAPERDRLVALLGSAG